MKTLFSVLFVGACLIHSVSGLGEVCDSDANCNDVNDERCKISEYCSNSKGSCVCKQGFKSIGYVCKRILSINEDCTANHLTTTCGTGATCNSTTNKCSCAETHTATPDGKHCKPKTEYNNEATCGSGNGCTGSGLVCDNGTCACPTDSHWVEGIQEAAEGYRVGACVHKRSKINLNEGDRCASNVLSVTVPQLVCGANLECTNCPDDYASSSENRICVKTSYSNSMVIKYSFSLLFAASFVLLLF